MKTEIKNMRICAVIVLFAAAGTVFSAVDLTKWKYCCRINFEDKPSGYCRMDITPEIYCVAKSDLSDIRIIGSDGQQAPYLIVRPMDTAGRRQYSPVIINRSTDAQKNSLATLDFGKKTVKNLIDVRTAGGSFRRAVKVEGSNDNVKFFTLVEQAFIFAVDYKEKFRFGDIDLPLNDYRYLRITVEPMAGEEKSPVIEDIRAFEDERKSAARMSANMLCINHFEDEADNLSLYEYDLGFGNLPINEIKLSVADESFYRHISIEGRNALKRKIKIESEDNRERFREVNVPWSGLAGGTIYRYIRDNGKKYEKTTLSLSGSPAYRYLRITIRNYDDKPLTLTAASAEMIAHKIVFDTTDSVGELLLYAGCGSASRPQYDIAHKLSNPLEVAAVSAGLGNVMENPLFKRVEQKPAPWIEQHKTLLLIILGVVVLVLGVFILKSFQSIKAADAE
jgi:hypothetical protein